jgi:hypothetical protein
MENFMSFAEPGSLEEMVRVVQQEWEKVMSEPVSSAALAKGVALLGQFEHARFQRMRDAQ